MWWPIGAGGIVAVACVLFTVTASRVLSFGPAAAGVAAIEERVPDEFWPGALLAAAYEGIPLPPNARIIGWDVGEGRAPATQVDLIVPASAADALAFYRRALRANGWYEALSWTSETPGGQPPAEPSRYGVFCQGAAGPWLLVGAAPMDSGSTFLRIHIGTEGTALCASSARPTPPSWGPSI